MVACKALGVEQTKLAMRCGRAVARGWHLEPSGIFILIFSSHFPFLIFWWSGIESDH